MKLLYSNDGEALVEFTRSEIEEVVDILDEAIMNYNYCEWLYSQFNTVLESMKMYESWKEGMTYNGKETDR